MQKMFIFYPPSHVTGVQMVPKTKCRVKFLMRLVMSSIVLVDFGMRGFSVTPCPIHSASGSQVSISAFPPFFI